MGVWIIAKNEQLLITYYVLILPQFMAKTSNILYFGPLGKSARVTSPSQEILPCCSVNQCMNKEWPGRATMV